MTCDLNQEIRPVILRFFVLFDPFSIKDSYNADTQIGLIIMAP